MIIAWVILPALVAASVVSSETLSAEVSQKVDRSSTHHYGIDLSGLLVKTASVKPGQTLSTILECYKIPASVIYKAAALSENVFDVRRVGSGRLYTIVLDPKSDHRVTHFIYEQTPEKFVVFDFGDPLRVYSRRRPLTIKTRMASGTITTSLWDAFAAQRLNAVLVSNLADIFASNVDCRLLQKGDSFKLIYEERYAGKKQVGIGGAIKMAELTSRGRVHRAFQFRTHDGKTGYYDENGLSLQKAFLISPLKYTRISSGFSERRVHPVTKFLHRHPAIDYAAPTGTPVMNVGDGIIGETGYSRLNGNYVKIRHAGAYASYYLHLSSIKKGIRKNSPVKKGDVIGFVGSTGLATGPHLCFRFLKNGRYLDFTKVELPSGEPIDLKGRERFNQKVALYKSKFLFSSEVTALAQAEVDKQKTLIETAKNEQHKGGKIKDLNAEYARYNN
jgi:murein DD-endopeptidase MepM/ murein hydrolase activator NlpD